MIDPKLTKFRPVLTLEQISYITSLCHASLTSSDLSAVYKQSMSESVKRVLVPMMAKVEVGAINPAYKLSEIQVIKNAERVQQLRYENNEMSQEESDAYELKILGEL